jgi:PAS domain S-box-containing protein
VVLIGTLLLSAVAAIYVSYSTNRALRRDYQHAVHDAAHEITDAISDRIDTYVSLLRGTAALFAANEQASRQQFHEYVSRLNLPQDYSGIRGIGYVLRVDPQDKESVEQDLRDQGVTGFHIWPASDGGEIYTVAYIEPFDPSHRAFGFNAFTDPVRREALERARDTGLAAASGRIVLLQDELAPEPSTRPAGVIIYLPVYRGGVDPGSVEERRENLLGFVYCPFRAGELLRGIGRITQQSLVDLTVYDESADPTSALYYTGPAPTALDGNVETQVLSVAGRKWVLAFSGRPEAMPRRAWALPISVMTAGCCLSLLLFIGMLSQVRGRAEAERTAAVLRRAQGAIAESERRFRTMVEQSPLGIQIFAPDGHVIETNQAWEKTWESKPGDLQSYNVLHDPQFEKLGLKPFVAQAFAGEPVVIPPFRYDPALSGRPGRPRWVQLYLYPVKDQAGQLREAVLIMHDMSEMKQAEEAVQRNQEQLRLVIDALPVFVGYLDHSKRLRLTNEVYEEWFDLPPLTAEGKALSEVFGEQAFHVAEPHIDLAFAGQRESYDDKLRFFDGSEHDIRATLIPHVGLAGHVEGVVMVISDVTERKQAENERSRLLAAEKEARTEAEMANRTKDDFLATLSHELRTPLNAILGWAQLMKAGGLPQEEISHGLDTIERNARVQSQLVEDLLDLSRIISGKLRLEMKVVDLPTVLEAALDSVRPAAEARKIQLVPMLDASASPVLGDPARLQQVVWNLLSNAIKFTPAGGRVELQLRRSGSQAEISVNDTGIGVDPEFLPYVFDRLRQADSSSTRRHGGLGLGLSIARHLIESHGGTIRAQSAGKDKGATFTASLPILHGAAVKPASGLSDGKTRANRNLAGVRILLVDDEEDARDLLSRVLKQDGAEVHAASSAAEALGAIDTLNPDVLISDIAMPGEDGYELIRKVRLRAPSHGGMLPAIALTAFARREDRDRALRAGFQTHLTKPVEAVELSAAVAELAHQ